MLMNTYAGIDLASFPKNQTGVCIYRDGRFECRTLYDDASIFTFIISAAPKVVAIDAPLTLPAGRCCFNDDCCGTRKIRECDRRLISMGYRVFPPGFSFMKQLTLRGKALREKLEASGTKVIEVHPRTSMRILGIDASKEFGKAASTQHEIDACASALTAKLYDEGKCVQVGDSEGMIVIPEKKDVIEK
ncbi:DUF429 domain-containing protein [Methanooceanicella nereidis]|uniref:DUF429 domain-containing protein n=1 Tax=Methanooceanicella nereidis TaxID=2052831 RepID=UPI001E46DE58